MMIEARNALLCNTRNCKFMKHPDIKTHCCGKCRKQGANHHGPRCKQHIITYMQCNRPNCDFMKHPDISNNGGTHCCFACHENKGHGGQCKKQRVGGRSEMKEQKLEVEVLEEFHGIDYPGHDIKHLKCNTLREARAIAAREIGGNKHLFAAFCKHRKKIWIKNHAIKNHPKVKAPQQNKHITLLYVKALFELGLAKCNRKRCNYMKDPDQNHGFCCLLCQDTGFHGPLCKKENMREVIREERRELKCDRPGCRYTKHPDPKNNGGTHCCFGCKKDGRHGGQCMKTLVREVIKEELKCERHRCQFVKHPDVKNNGGTHCCKACKQHGRHGHSCTNKRVGNAMKNVATGFV